VSTSTPDAHDVDDFGEATEVEAAVSEMSSARRRIRTTGAFVTTAFAVVLVWFAVVGPDQLNLLSVRAFLRIPIEGLLLVACLLVLPTRPRHIVAAAVGALLGVLTLVKILDMGFFSVLDRPFNPVIDWGNFVPAVGVLRDSVGRFWADAAVVGAVVLVVAVLVFTTLSSLRLTKLAVKHRRRSARTVAALGVVWVLCAAFGVQAAAGAPVASTSAAGLVYDQARAIRQAVADQRTFASGVAADDKFADTPGGDLLKGLRGKDVVVAFVESYGQVAVQGSAFSPQVDAVLNAGTKSLHDAGYSARSAFLTSPTFGGISWLAHSTFQSGLWIDNQQRYNQLVASDRFTLSDAFKSAGWRTVGDIPSNENDWQPATSFYHYDQLYDGRNVGYRGPTFSYATMPDQYILSAFQRNELAKPGHQPVMAEIDLVSSHTPWAPLPQMVDWNSVGDGSIFDGMPAQGQSPSVVWRSTSSVRAAYGQSIQYSLSALIGFVENVHDNNLVLILLGDHQPATTVSGPNASHNVPITIISHDSSVLSRISLWRWQNGMLPSPDAPVWPMDAFRDRFLAAFEQ
jgi:hypothetical protein